MLPRMLTLKVADACVRLAPGTVSERPKEHVSKTCDGASHPWVQIPPVPPLKYPGITAISGYFFALVTRSDNNLTTPVLIRQGST